MNIKEKIDKILPSNSDKKVILFGAGGMGLNALYLLKRFGKRVDYCVDNNQDRQGQKIWDIEIKSPCALMDEHKEKVIIFVAVIIGLQEIAKSLDEMGYIYNQHYFYTLGMEVGASLTYMDPILSYFRGDEADFEKVPFIGMNEKKERNVLVLGNSTTDGTWFGIKSWPYYLQQKLGGKVQVYNGAVLGYTSSQCLLKLIRDAFFKIKPDLVIDSSGVTEATIDLCGFTLPFFSKNIEKLIMCYKKNESKIPDIYYGVTAEKVQRYITNIRMMRGICQELGSEFISILPPVMLTCENYICNAIEQEYLRVPETERAVRKLLDFYSKAIEEIDRYEYIYDLTKIFDNNKYCFVDYVHCNEKGNEIIANKVCEILREKGLVE